MNRSRSMLSLFVAGALFTNAALWSPAAFAIGVSPGAATPVQREQAQTRFLKGRELFNKKKYAEALEEFRASFEIVASPNARLYIARALRELGKLVEAYVEFGRTEVEAKELAPTDARYVKTGESAAIERKEIGAKLAFVTVTIDHAEEKTTLKLSGEEVRRAGWGEPAPVAPGNIEVLVETPGKQPLSKTVTLAAGQQTSLTIDAATASVTAEGKPTEVEKPKEEPKPSSEPTDLKPYAYVAGGIGVAGMLTFVVFGAMANSKYSTLKDECGATGCASRQDEIDSGKSSQRIANIGLVVGVVGLAAGVTLFVIGNKNKPATPSAEVVAAPSFIGLRGSF